MEKREEAGRDWIEGLLPLEVIITRREGEEVGVV